MEIMLDPKVIKEFDSSVIIALDASDDAKLHGLQALYDPSEVVEDLHITLLFLGEMKDLEREGLVKTISEIAYNQAPIEGIYNGVAVFAPEPDSGKYPHVLLYDSPQLSFLFEKLVRLFTEDRPDLTHGFTPHTTLAYSSSPNSVIKEISYKKTFNRIYLFWGKEHIDFILQGTHIEKQVSIDDPSKIALVRARIEVFQRDADRLSERVFTGEITLGGYEESMRKLVRELHSGVAAIAKGGWGEMTQSDWGRLGNPMKEQYRYLHGFMESIAENRETISLDAIQARARLYGNAAGYTAAVMQAGDFASLLPWMPRDGSTECLVGCKCRWVLTVIDTLENGEKLVQAVWTLNPTAESCNDCVDRFDYTELVTVGPGVHVPSSIGGY